MRVLLGVSGGIAAYKAAELVRELQHRGVDVQVAMTRGAEEFVQPLTFAALSGHPVLTSLWTPSTDPVAAGPEAAAGAFSIEHIDLAQSIDALILAPATASLLARLAHGLSDDLLATVYLATRAPVLIAPAMNVNMWEHAATQANVATLRARGAHIVEPGSGYLACGMTGGGRLAEPAAIADAALRLLVPREDLAGETVLITAGGTREAIDPVRFLSNRSSGKMGHALAEAALARGARVLLVTAAATVPPLACEIVRVGSAAEMHAAVLDALPTATVVVGAAAVSDFRPRDAAAQKIKRSGAITLELEPVPDILRDAAARRSPGTMVIAFAAETENLLPEARRKLRSKGVDAVVANIVAGPRSAFDADRNSGWWVSAESETALPEGSKREMADAIFDGLLRLRTTTPQPAR